LLFLDYLLLFYKTDGLSVKGIMDRASIGTKWRPSRRARPVLAGVNRVWMAQLVEGCLKRLNNKLDTPIIFLYRTNRLMKQAAFG